MKPGPVGEEIATAGIDRRQPGQQDARVHRGAEYCKRSPVQEKREGG